MSIRGKRQYNSIFCKKNQVVLLFKGKYTIKSMKKCFLFVLPLFFLMVFLFDLTPVNAANYGLSETARQTSYKTSETPTAIATKAINAVLAVVYIIFFVLVLYAGIRWMTAQGNEENVTKAKNILEAAIIGVVLISAAYAITSFVFSKIGSGGAGGGSDNTVGGSDNTVEGGEICCKCGNAASDLRGTNYSTDPDVACVETCNVFGYTITQSLGYTIGECTGSGPSASSDCTDGQKNGDESDVDCGGSCAKCTAGKSCRNGSNDCQGVCYTDNKCRDL